MLSNLWKIFVIPATLCLVLVAGCAGHQKPDVDVPCLSSCAVQAASCAMRCFQPPQPEMCPADGGHP